MWVMTGAPRWCPRAPLSFVPPCGCVRAGCVIVPWGSTPQPHRRKGSRIVPSSEGRPRSWSPAGVDNTGRAAQRWTLARHKPKWAPAATSISALGDIPVGMSPVEPRFAPACGPVAPGGSPANRAPDRCCPGPQSLAAVGRNSVTFILSFLRCRVDRGLVAQSPPGLRQGSRQGKPKV